jgi:hypothetical protein
MNRKDFEKAKRFRYQLMGWDEKSGIPTENKLVDLELGCLVNNYNLRGDKVEKKGDNRSRKREFRLYPWP